jgi:hypothetical protein
LLNKPVVGLLYKEINCQELEVGAASLLTVHSVQASASLARQALFKKSMSS